MTNGNLDPLEQNKEQKKSIETYMQNWRPNNALLDLDKILKVVRNTF